MSILVSQITLPHTAHEGEAVAEALRVCGLRRTEVTAAGIYRRSFDLRRGDIRIQYTVELGVIMDDAKLVSKLGLARVRLRRPPVTFAPSGRARLSHSPVVVGFGPAGLFAALVLAENGYRPLVLERGAPVDRRDRSVASFYQTGTLDERSNIQFGEGGAGAYSDGKLVTRISDPLCETVLDRLVAHGAPASVAQSAKPHIGTDLLRGILVSMREYIVRCGGRVCFDTLVTGVQARDGALAALQTEEGAVPCDVAVLAIGHSARDTYAALRAQGVGFEPKAFSVGVRIEHWQEDVDRALYGRFAGHSILPPGEYALSHRDDGRACYTFCMCPGGEVVAAASEQGRVVTNGMSRHARDGRNANSALVVSVSPSDFDGADALAGVAFQRMLEERAFAAGGGAFAAPVQLFGDFLKGSVGAAYGRVRPTYARGCRFAPLHELLPAFVTGQIRGAAGAFGRKLRGFDAPDALLTGIETRTSSPVRITRDAQMDSVALRGLVPCGEGAGYAGGIVSAAVDGLRAAQEIMRRYAPIE